MTTTNEEHLVDYLEEQLERYQNIYGGDLNKRFLKFYENIPAPLDKLFAFFHENFNSLLDYLNTKSRSGHYNADESRMLYTFITDIKTLQDTAIDTSFAFELDSYYSQYLDYCKTFIRTSGGSPLPNGFIPAKVNELNPIFTLKTGLTAVRPTGIFTFPAEKIGGGSYATVYKYLDPLYDHEFAYKQALDTLKEDEIERFYREFEVMKGLKYPFILDVYSLDKEKNYYIMECADETLEDYVEQHPNLENLREKLIFVRQICNAFQYIHSKGILHRDISPKNILIKHLDDSKMIKVADFGLVKIPESKVTRFATEPKGSLNDPHLRLTGFKNYEMRHETYALTRLIYYIFTGRLDDGIFTNAKFEEFFRKGIHFETENRFANIQELANAFLNDVAPSIAGSGV
ncbi:protein kinase [Bacillus wiedmannii]|uniref:protein kinase domain-containing protein n=1 Tax=Bacillus wiedmannii TaxID=1890302 RepID=UPI0021D370B5|nr:protein kinase [Bacillus wiedmannii]MCU5516140.1 protein kinase [Bacillus wiedmannii]